MKEVNTLDYFKIMHKLLKITVNITNFDLNSLEVL